MMKNLHMWAQLLSVLRWCACCFAVDAKHSTSEALVICVKRCSAGQTTTLTCGDTSGVLYVHEYITSKVSQCEDYRMIVHRSHSQTDVDAHLKKSAFNTPSGSALNRSMKGAP